MINPVKRLASKKTTVHYISNLTLGGSRRPSVKLETYRPGNDTFSYFQLTVDA